jgi:hypothetical protein
VTRINIAPIVEGQGDNASVRDLLWRTWTMLGGEHAEVIPPIRRSRGKFLKEAEQDLEHAVALAALKVTQAGSGMILILVDAEDDCERLGSLGPKLLARAVAARSDLDICCVIANVMFETWFIAAAESLAKYLDLDGVAIPEDPEAVRAGKGWIKKHMKSGHYSETIDQPRLTAALDLQLCRTRSKSYDKLCRELELRLKQTRDFPN